MPAPQTHPTRAAFDQFYMVYRRAHRHPMNRALHLAAKLAMGATLGAAAALDSLWPILALPVAGIAPCWLGHWVFEGNDPAALSLPSSSVIGALRMVATGRARDLVRPAAGHRIYFSLAADLRMCAGVIRAAMRCGSSVRPREHVLP